MAQAYFDNIRQHIRDELRKAQKSIYVAVAWFTDHYLFEILCERANEGLDVQIIIMDDDITRACSIEYEDLENNGGKLYMVDKSHGTLMHHKFCVIDENTVITGSYNWSHRASLNHENITINEDSDLFALKFLDEFKNIKQIYHGEDPLKPADFTKINVRLRIINDIISLGDYEDVPVHARKLSEYILPDSIKRIVSNLESEDWAASQLLLVDYLKNSQALLNVESINIAHLKWKIQYIENEILALENEKTTIQKIISDFVHTYTLRFGELLIEILKLKKEKLKKQGHAKFEEFKNAEEAFHKFKEEFFAEKEKEITSLDENDQLELKKKYRKAAVLCHPDTVYAKFGDDAAKIKEAEKIFVALKSAYERNDLKTITTILENLENGIYDFQMDADDSHTSTAILEARLQYLNQRYKDLLSELVALRNDKTYLRVINTYDMDAFFREEEERLKNELKDLKNGR